MQCIISAKVDKMKRTVHNKHWWNSGRRYELAQFRLQLIPGHADLKFELRCGDELINNEEDRVQVAWGADRARMSITSMDGLSQPYV
jgi:hypothetical protein